MSRNSIELIRVEGQSPRFEKVDLSKHRPQCRCKRGRNSVCPWAHSWAHLTELHPESFRNYLELLSLQAHTALDRKTAVQIEKDLPRTHPQVNYFSKGPGKQVLRRVLHAYAWYNSSVGYVQGINFLAAALLWHASEVDAFWLLVSLMDDYGLRENYLPGLPGLNKHAHVVEYLTMDQLPNLYKHFLEHNILIGLFTNEWCLTLFSCLIPLEDMKQVLDYFFRFGWNFFYKMVLAILEIFSPRLMRMDELSAILSLLKPYNSKHAQSQDGINNFNWKNIIKKALAKNVHEEFINCLYYNCDSET